MNRWQPKALFVFLLLATNSLFAITLGKVVVSDPLVGPRTIVYEKIGDYAIAEGDIIIGKTADLSRKNAFILLPRIGGGRWAQGVVPFTLSEELPLISKLAVLKAMDYLQQNTSIQFVELNARNRDNYPDYLVFNPAEGTMCASHVGRHGGPQEVNLSLRCNTMNTVHEICHALGLWHEQSRADSPSYIRILWENIEDEHKFNFNQHLTDGSDFGEYDYQSIMHYPPFAFSKNGKKTIEPLLPDVEIGQRRQLSEKDIAAINAMYPQD